MKNNNKSYNNYKNGQGTYQSQQLTIDYKIPKYTTDEITNEKEVSSLLIFDIIGHFPLKNELIELNGKNVLLNHTGKIVRIKEII